MSNIFKKGVSIFYVFLCLNSLYIINWGYLKSAKILLMLPKYETITEPSNYFIQYCDIYFVLFVIAPCKFIALNCLCFIFSAISLLNFWYNFISLSRSKNNINKFSFTIANGWKNDNYTESITENKPWINIHCTYKTNKKWSKGVKSDIFCYRKIGSAITKWRAIEKSPILISQYL